VKEQTIYSYKLLYRFRWRFFGVAVQLVILACLVTGCSFLLKVPLQQLIVSLSINAAVPVMQFLLLKLYAYSVSAKVQVTPDSLLSPWWGAGSKLPVSLSFFRRAELTVCLGSLLIPAALFVWLPFSYELALIIGTVVLTLPRVLALLSSIGKPARARVKYGNTSISFLLTDG